MQCFIEYDVLFLVFGEGVIASNTVNTLYRIKAVSTGTLFFDPVPIAKYSSHKISTL
jgi:hypothetical protein